MSNQVSSGELNRMVGDLEKLTLHDLDLVLVNQLELKPLADVS